MGVSAAGEAQRRVVTKGAAVVYKCEDAHADHPGSGPEYAAIVSALHPDREGRRVTLTVFSPNSPSGTFSVSKVPWDAGYPTSGQVPGESVEQRPDTWRFPGGYEEFI